MMKSIKNILWLLIVFILVFVVLIIFYFTGNHSINLISNENEIISILEKFDEELDLDKSNIVDEEFEWSNFYNSPVSGYNIRGYAITGVSGINPSDMVDTNKLFDGWNVNYIGDEMYGSLIEYSKDDIICYYSLFLDKEIPYELMVGEDENGNPIDYEKGWEEFYKTATYSVDLSCGRISKNIHKLISENYNLVGNELNWNAYIRGGRITIFDDNGVHYFYPDSLKYDGNVIEFSGYHISGLLDGGKCINKSNGVDFGYSASLDFIDEHEEVVHYEGCANPINFEFTQGEEGTLSHFMEKTKYSYSHEYDKHRVYYIIDEIVGDYIEVRFYINDENGEYHDFQIIMKKADDEWITLFDGDSNTITDDQCEELNQYDNNLMDMFFLVNCPRG